MKIVVYTHTDYSWVHPHWFKQTDKYLADYQKVLFINDATNIDRSDYTIVTYDDKLTYRNRVYSCLISLSDEDVIMFNHEDMFLYARPDYEKLTHIHNLVKTDEVHLVKLLRNGYQLDRYKDINYLYHNKNGFSIQPTITKVRTLKQIYSSIPGDTIWSFEESSMTLVNNWGLTNLFIYDGCDKRGENHWDSNIYPYVATAVVKGRWNDEYISELSTILYG